MNGRFVSGKPFALEATYTWKSEADFERFMRFAQRYAAANDLGYSKNPARMPVRMTKTVNSPMDRLAALTAAACCSGACGMC